MIDSVLDTPLDPADKGTRMLTPVEIARLRESSREVSDYVKLVLLDVPTLPQPKKQVPDE